MSKMVELLHVFVASPSDVDEERLALEKVVNELNRSLPDQYGVQLGLVRSDTHTYPGFGMDAQDVVNSQIRDNYDIFIPSCGLGLGLLLIVRDRGLKRSSIGHFPNLK